MDGLTFIYILLGLAIGSFVSVVTYRIPKNLGFVKGRSFCDKCKKELKWYENIPLFSFLYNKGTSKCCKRKISIRYPLLEIVSVIAILMLSPFNYLLFVALLSIFVIDLENQFIPDELSWLVLFLGLFNSDLTSFFAGFLFGLVFLFLHLVTKGHGMGLGDVKLAIPLGLLLGLDKGLYWIMVSFILGGLVAFFLLLLRRLI